MSKPEHEHDYVAEKQKYQELDNKYVGTEKYQMATLEQERIVIFCRTCGDWRRLESTDE